MRERYIWFGCLLDVMVYGPCWQSCILKKQGNYWLLHCKQSGSFRYLPRPWDIFRYYRRVENVDINVSTCIKFVLYCTYIRQGFVIARFDMKIHIEGETVCDLLVVLI
jgi:hypothetical protein